ncbi:MAG: NAD(P)-dependent oxidoreductase [Salinarimonas sp.]
MSPPLALTYIHPPIYPSFVDVAQAAPEIALTRLTLDDDAAAIAATLSRSEGYYVMASRDELPVRWHLGPKLLAQMPDLLVAASYGAGYDTIDVEACTAAGVGVVNQAGGNAEGVAQHTLGIILTLLKRIPESEAAMRAGAVRERDVFLGRELSGRCVGLIGIGRIGTRVAELLGVFGCRVLADDPLLDAATITARGGEKVDRATLLREADIISVHCPLNATTRGMLDARFFDAMRPEAVFINTARGGIHDEGALHAALAREHLGGAGLDVWEREPPPRDHPLLAHPRVIASPHTAGVTHESRNRVARMAAEAFIATARGEIPPRLVNPEVEPRLRERISRRFGAPRSA